MNQDLKASVAEFLGTFTLVFIGAGAGAMAAPERGGGGIVAVALAHGIALLVCVYVWGGISGCHVNPAVTLSLLVTGKIGFPRALMYWVAQFVGGIAAGFLLLYLVGDTALMAGLTRGSLTETEPVKVVVIEAVLTAFLVFAVYGSAVAAKNGNAIGIAIGLVLAMDILMGGYLTGASMNPARTFGPALAVSQPFNHVWMYFVGPAIGGIVAAVIHDQIMLKPAAK
jgi:MIP family channel proteins